MVWAGAKLAREAENPWPGLVLTAFGAGTIAYNGENYLRVRSGVYIPGGKAEGRNARWVNPRQLRLGIKTEMEHTSDPDIAREIALDHLIGEDPKYYTKLRKAGL